MAFTFAWSDAAAVAAKMAKDIPLSSIDETLCNMVNGEIWDYYDWSASLDTIGSAQVALSDGTQDFTAVSNCYKPIRLSIVRTDSTPDEHRDINVVKTLPVDLTPRSYRSISCASLEPAVGQFRLESAVQVPSGVTLELRGVFKKHPDKITALTDDFWFEDRFLDVAAKGLIAYYKDLGDDRSAGSTSNTRKRGTSSSGWWAKFEAAMQRMAEAEDFGNIDSVFPSSSMGASAGNGAGLSIFR
jgi:hypothetical protein